MDERHLPETDDDFEMLTYQGWVTYTKRRSQELTLDEAAFLAMHRTSNYLAVLVAVFVIIPIAMMVLAVLGLSVG